MTLHHELEDIAQEMKSEGYEDYAPVIDPETLQKLCEGVPRLEVLFTHMVDYCYRYSHDVFTMLREQKRLEELRKKGLDSREDYLEVREMDEKRHRLHEAMIQSVNSLSLELSKQGRDNTWMEEIVSNGRAGYAQFALLTFYKNYVRVKVPLKHGAKHDTR
jgi:hypothetical protein